MEVFPGLAVVAEDLDPGFQIGIAGNHSAGLAEGAKILSGIATETPRDAYRAGFDSTVKGAMSLAGVFDHGDAVLRSDFEDWAHISSLTEQVDRDDGFRSRGDGTLELSRIQSVGLFVDVHEDGPRAGEANRLRGGHESS